MHILSPGYRNTNVAALYAAASGGLLDGSESDGTNLITDSGHLDFSGWNTLNSTLTANNATAPDGTTTAARMLEDSSTGRHILYLTPGFITAGGTYTYSFYAKSITRRYFQLLVAGSSKIYAYFDLQTGTVTDSGTANPDGSTAVISTNCEAGANGFYKCTLRGICDGTSTLPYFVPSLSDVATYGSPLDANSPSYAGNTSNGAYLWRPKMTT